MLKRGYDTGLRILEVIEGNIDLVLYNNKGTSFYFYRFSAEDVIGKKIQSNRSIVNQKELIEFLQENGKSDYMGLINELLIKAWDSKMEDRYEM